MAKSYSYFAAMQRDGRNTRKLSQTHTIGSILKNVLKVIEVHAMSY